MPYHWTYARIRAPATGTAPRDILAARLRPKTAAEYVTVGNKIGADFKHGLSMAQSVERARALDAGHGELRRPPPGPALSGYAGKKATRNYLARVEHGRRPGGLTRHPLCPGPEASGPLARPRRRQRVLSAVPPGG